MKNKTIEIKNLKIEDLKEGDFILCPPNDLIGKLIVRLSGGVVSHSAIYSGIVNGKPTIAHAHKYGIIYNTLEELFTFYDESFCYVRRNPNLQTVQPTMESADMYIKEGNPYSFANLTILSLLGIFSKLSAKIIKNETYFDILENLALSLMKDLSKLLHKDKHPMTCSQFVAQCYTNKEYIIQFEKLIVDTEIRKGVGDTTSLWEIMQQKSMTRLLKIEELNISEYEEVDSEDWNNRIAVKLNDLLDRYDAGLLPEDTVSDEDIARTGIKLLTILYELKAISSHYGVSKAIDMIPDDRNFFVTPDDLYLNAIDFIDIGSFDGGIFTR
ncbi:hypothetical protein JGH11_07920 [Dysgonomonas sp. Marseille-P4677]|uniref:hypothetical protein n=1 Tax=Dysgonomonas sp. Marseille-P4677 TaxID=2364790 RepID=UPI0019147F15|nr:hypothetical protein [Dysgonomonas sp. Marseille-P4677]MBK5720798.1 hypothetical protein [Dysgonomonas sp. Marseille-P4677]